MIATLGKLFGYERESPCTSRKKQEIGRHRFLGMLTLCFALFALPAFSQSNIPSNNASTANTSTAPESSSPALKVLQDYVTVVGGVVAALGAVFGLPLTYQTFQKTRAEIRKINLESEKMESESVGSGQFRKTGEGISIVMEGGERNVVNLQHDPRLAIPLLLLIDALIAYVYYRICSFVVDLVPLGRLLTAPVYFAIFMAIFYPVFQTARRIKKQLGRDWLGETDQGRDQQMPDKTANLTADPHR